MLLSFKHEGHTYASMCVREGGGRWSGGGQRENEERVRAESELMGFQFSPLELYINWSTT